MPRTKYIRKTKTADESRESYHMILETFERHVQQRIANFERETQANIKSFETLCDCTVSRLPTEIRKMQLGEILVWQNDNHCNIASLSDKDRMQPPTGTVMPKLKGNNGSIKRVTTVSDDGYVTESGTSSTDNTSRTGRVHAQISTTRRTRSTTKASKTKFSEINQKTISKPKRKDNLNVDNFKTPAPPRLENMYDVVTPKVKPNTPLNVLRRPRQGEMVLSMQGSPLLVSAIVEEKTANINVPLGNGNVISLLPQEGLRMSHIPVLDSEVMQQLETLKNHIEKVIALK